MEIIDDEDEVSVSSDEDMEATTDSKVRYFDLELSQGTSQRSGIVPQQPSVENSILILEDDEPTSDMAADLVSDISESIIVIPTVDKAQRLLS